MATLWPGVRPSIVTTSEVRAERQRTSTSAALVADPDIHATGDRRGNYRCTCTPARPRSTTRACSPETTILSRIGVPGRVARSATCQRQSGRAANRLPQAQIGPIEEHLILVIASVGAIVDAESEATATRRTNDQLELNHKIRVSDRLVLPPERAVAGLAGDQDVGRGLADRRTNLPSLMPPRRVTRRRRHRKTNGT